MSMSADFLKEVKVGDYVSIFYEPNRELEGVVLELTEDSVKIKAENRTPRVGLSRIIEYEVLEREEPEPAPVKKPEEPVKPEPAPAPAPAPAPKNVPEPASAVKLPERVQALLDRLEKVTPMDRDMIVNWDSVVEDLMDPYYPKGLRDTVRSVCSDYKHARDALAYDSKRLEDRLHDPFAKLIRLSGQEPDAKEDLMRLLGAMNYQIGNYADAERYYLNGADHVGAVYAALNRGNKEAIDEYLDGFMRNPTALDAYLYKLYSDSAYKRRNILAMKQRVQELRRVTELHEADFEELENLCACAVRIGYQAKLSLQWAATYEDNYALQCLEQFLYELPSEWITTEEQYKRRKAETTGPKRYNSYIKTFNTKSIWGFIFDTPRDRYFYIDQVNKDDCLRTLLAREGMADNLEVSYCLGIPYKQGEPYSAYDIRLTERGARDAERRMKELQALEETRPEGATEPENYHLRPYVPLEPAPEGPQKVKKPEPKEQPVVRPVVPIVPKEDTHARTLPPLEPLPGMGKNRFVGLPGLTGHFYETAVHAQQRGDLKKAEELFIKALQADEQSGSCISNLVTIYLQQKTRMNDAIHLLEAFGSRLTPEKRVAHEIRIYQQGKLRPYRIKMCHLIEEALGQSIKVETKMHYMSIQADSLRVLGEYEMALNSYKRLRQMYDSEVQYRGNSAVAQFAMIRNAITKGEAFCHYNLGNKTRSQELAKELLRISSKDEMAKGIIEGTLEQDSEVEFFVPTDEELDIEHSEITNYASVRLKNAPLVRYLKKETVENGQYIGDYKMAHKDIEYIFTTSVKGRNASQRNEGLMCMARIVRTVLDRYGSDKKLEKELRKLELTESMEKTYIARSMASYGDTILLEQKKNPDTSRFVYLQAIATLPKGEVDWTKSMLHYIHSYFHPEQDMSQFVRNNMEVRRPTLDLEILRTQRPQESGEFLTGMIQLYKTLEGSRKDERFRIVEELRKNPAIGEITQILEDSQLPAVFDNIDGCIKTLNQAAIHIQKLHNEVKELLALVPSQMFSRVQCEDLCDKLDELLRSSFLGEADRKRLREIYNTLREFQSYFNGREFHVRVGNMNTAIRRIGNLTDEIMEFPSQLSYDVIRPALDLIRSALMTRLEKLHEDLPPALEIELMPGTRPYLGRGGEVNVELVIRNGNAQNKGDERQLADNLEVYAISQTEGVQFARHNLEEARCVYGGESIGTMLEFQIKDNQLLALGTFDISVVCGYRYNVRPAEAREIQITVDIPIVFRRSQHDEIRNPYRNHIGKEMKDEDIFYGRDELIEELIATMRREDGRFNYGQGILLYGQTRSGKSSVRHIFKKRVADREPKAVLVDIGNISDIKEEAGSLFMLSFYQKIVDALDQEIRTRHTDLKAMQIVEGIESPINRMLDRPEMAGMLCRRYLVQLKDLLERSGKMIVLIIDEFSAIHDAIKAGSLEESFMQTWKSMLENSGIFAVCFGQDDTPLFALANQNAFGRMVQKKVTYLEELYAKQLMSDPIRIEGPDGSPKSRYTEDACNELYSLTAGSTFLTVKVCSLLVDYLNDQSAEIVTPGILSNFLSSKVFKGNECLNETDFEPQIGDRADKSLEDMNRQLLLDIARRSQANGWAEVRMLPKEYQDIYQDKPRTRRTEALLQRLYDRDVIDLEEGSRCRIKVGLLTKLLLYKYGKE